MPGTATIGTLRAILSADVTEFSRAMDVASGDVKALSDKLQSQLEPRQRAVNAAIRDFLGTDDIRRAQEYSLALDKIGSTSSLTEANQRKVNSAVSAAIEQYQALGQKAPENLLKLQQETAKVETAWQKADNVLNTFGLSLASLTVAGAIAGFVAAGKSAIEFGSHLTDLRDQTGLTLDELQRLNYAGATVGLSLDQIAAAVNKLQKNLVADGSGAAEALHKIGLEQKALLAESPGQMFEDMATAIAKLPDPTERTSVAMALLGKSGAELLPLMLAKVKELGDAAPKMSDDTIEALDHFDDAWAKSKIVVMSTIGSMIGEVTSFRTFLEKGGLGSVGEYFAQANHGMEDVSKSLDTMGASLQKNAQIIPGVIPPLSNAEAALKAFDSANKDNEAQIRKNIAAYEAHQQSIKQLVDQMTGASLQKHITDLAEAFKLAANAGGLSADQLMKLSKELADARTKGVVLPPVLNAIADASNHSADVLQRELLPVLYEFNDEIPRMTVHIGTVTDAIKILDKETPTIKKLAPPPADPWRDFKDAVSSTLKQLDTAIQGSFAQMILGAKSFHDGFVDIWNSLKASVSRIVAEFVSDITGRLLKGLVNVLEGTASFGSSFAGIMGQTATAASTTASGVVASTATMSTALISLAATAITAGAAVAAAYGAYEYAKYVFQNPRGYTTTPLPAGDDGQYHPPSGYYDDGTVDPSGPYGYQLQGLAGGGVVQPRSGGTPLRIAEASYPETVIPGDWSDLVNGAMAMPIRAGWSGDGASTPSGPAPSVSASGSNNTGVSAVYLDSRLVGRALFGPIVREAARQQVTQR